MLNISATKELLHKPSQIHWNTTGKIWVGALSYKILLPEITKSWELAICRGGGVLWRPGNQCGIQCFFMILWISESSSLNLLVKNTFNLKLGFFTYFEYISGVIIRKDILCLDYYSARWYSCKKDQRNLPQTSHKVFFSTLNCEFFTVMSICGSKLLWKFILTG